MPHLIGCPWPHTRHIECPWPPSYVTPNAPGLPLMGHIECPWPPSYGTPNAPGLPLTGHPICCTVSNAGPEQRRVLHLTAQPLPPSYGTLPTGVQACLLSWNKPSSRRTWLRWQTSGEGHQGRSGTSVHCSPLTKGVSLCAAHSWHKWNGCVCT